MDAKLLSMNREEIIFNKLLDDYIDSKLRERGIKNLDKDYSDDTKNNIEDLKESNTK